MAIDEQALDIVRAGMRAKAPRGPSLLDKVYKEECAFSFDTPLSPGGLYISLSSWQGFGRDYVQLDSQRSSNRLYLHERWTKVPLPEEEVAKSGARPDRLAIGGQGGFQVDAERFSIAKEHALVVLPEFLRVPLPCPDLPELVLGALSAVMAHDSASGAEDAARWEEERRVSRYANDLPLLETGLGRWGRQIPPDSSQWACDETGATENLWLNLSTGFIGSGRQNWDGSGGNGAAMRHYEATGSRYPLVVKLGTITPHGADVYSYASDENDMVLDPHLAEHLAHWGINMMAMQKTEKTMAELQIDLNMSFEFDKITESGVALEPLSGPGYMGLKNLGNSCYMNSVLQALWALPQVAQRYAARAPAIYASAPADPASDFPTQMAKLGVALTEGRTGAGGSSGSSADVPMANGCTGSSAGVREPDQAPAAEALGADACAVRPAAFKALVGRGHSEFQSNRQQDAVEYFQHLLEVMARSERASGGRLGDNVPDLAPTQAAFQFGVEDRVRCAESGRVSYRRTPANVLALDIDPAAATNSGELEEYQERIAKRARLKEEDAAAYIQAGTLPDGGGGAGAPAKPVISKETKETPVLPRVPFSSCVERWAADEELGDYYSAVLNKRTTATRRSRIASFPPFLMVQLKRYYVDKDWTAKKLEVLVDVQDKLDLEHLRAKGPQPDEQLQPEDVATPNQAGMQQAGAAAVEPDQAVQPDPEIVASLTAMGFSENGSKRAAVATQNAGTEACMEWVLGHMEDADFNDPLPAPAAAAAPPQQNSAAAPDPGSVAMLASMGFTAEQAQAALRACNGSLERAADWLFSRGDSLDADVAAQNASPAAAPAASTPVSEAAGAGRAPATAAAAVDDGPGRYTLVGIISHMGSNTACGHYVAHIRKAGRWVIFNDDKVAASANPPKDLGYLYMFQREDPL